MEAVVATAVSGRVKWYDETKGFGFVVSDEMPGDILVHHRLLKEHRLKRLLEGSAVKGMVVEGPRGLLFERLLEIEDNSPPLRQKIGEAGEFQPVEVNWYNALKGFGFVYTDTSLQAFIHAEVVRQSGRVELVPGERIEGRIAGSGRGPVVTEIR